MGREPLGEYVGRKEAARLLGINVRTVTLWTRQGLLSPRLLGDKRELRYRRDELQMLRLARADKNTDVWQVKALALQALATARATELRLMEVFDHLGLNAVALDRDPESIRRLYDELEHDLAHSDLRDPSWMRLWGGRFFAMDEVYLELVEDTCRSDEPWKRFMDFSNAVLRAAPKVADAIAASTELQLAYKYFEAGSRHLWYLGYMLCRRIYGRCVADTVFDGSRSAIDELMAILH